MLSDDAMYKRMVNGWRGGRKDGTVCGNGSTIAHSLNVMAALPQWAAKYGIRTVCDAGAGDLHWVRRVEWTVDYRAFDLIARSDEVAPFDITRDVLPKCDLILCRMVLNHLDVERNRMALARFRQSGKYLAATHFQGEDLPQRSPQFTRLDLRHEPYNLGEPIECVQDGHEGICRFALWALNG